MTLSSRSSAPSTDPVRMGWGSKPALLIIDVCKAYWTPASPLSLLANPSATLIPAKIQKLLTCARSSTIPVVWTAVRYAAEADMQDAGLFYKKCKSLDLWKVGDERGWDGWMNGIEPADGEQVIYKNYASGFFGTELKGVLAGMGVDTVVVCGVSTSGCVRATALDAMQSGFRPMVVGDACGDRSVAIHDANLYDLNAKYADVVSVEEAIEKMNLGWM